MSSVGRLYWSEAVGVSATAFDAYDAAGRPTQYHQSFWTGSAYGPGFGVQRTYNKAGGVTSQTYPSGRVVTYNYDSAGRPGDYNGQAAVAGNLGDGVQRTYASEVRYHELGGREQERFGTQTPVYNKSLYNSRAQLAEIRVSTHSILSPGQETNWNRGAIINHYSKSPGAWGASGGGPDNNGNLKNQEIYIPDNDQITGYTNIAQEYNYDSLNRLTSVYDKPFNGAADFYQAYTYDRWGNRTIDPGTYGVPEPQFTASTATNRLSPPAGYTMTYDAAGNLTFDNYTGAGTRTYDGENRMTSAQDYYGQTSTYAYDGEGKRVRRTVAGGASVWQVYGMGGELLAEYATNALASTPQKEYGYRGGELLVQATAPVSTGTGLTAKYFDNANFTDLKLTRTDSTVNFDWGGGTPHATVGVDTFSVRWEGKVEPLYSQTYTFYTLTDDGVRLWVNNQLVIDKWTDQGPTEWSGQIALTAGQRYDIRLEFYENGGGATAKLLWSSASQSKAAIAQSRLYPAGAGNAQVDLRWLVSDQLGTPRMLIDQTGNLSGVKRHDYLPFGEEIPSDSTWRTVARGYVGDNVRQEFTKYERDTETGLDYAQARYFASAQGRFTSVDPLMASAVSRAPQTWNRYAYALNNPLRLTDPSGMMAEQTDEGQQPAQPAPPPQQKPQSPPKPVATQTATLPNVPSSSTGQVPTTVVIDQMNNPGVRQRNVKGTDSLVVGVDLRFTFLDQKGDPLTNATVVESVTDSTGQKVTQTEEPVPLDANGQGGDLVSNVSGPVPKSDDTAGQQNAIKHFNKEFTTAQTLTLTVTTETGMSVKVTQQRTLTNTVAGAPPIAGGLIKGYTFTMEKPKIEVVK
jgi:RHS repeat-associated protein